jgi:ABC-type sugar transport system ATPase subunit
VAGFIGSPAMNFLPGKGAEGGRIALDAGGSLPHAQGGVAAGQPVVVGVRPEHLVPASAADAAVSGNVELVEQLGADTLVHVSCGSAMVVARLPGGARAEVGATLALAVDSARVYLFDAATGARIRG